MYGKTSRSIQNSLSQEEYVIKEIFKKDGLKLSLIKLKVKKGRCIKKSSLIIQQYQAQSTYGLMLDLVKNSNTLFRQKTKCCSKLCGRY